MLYEVITETPTVTPHAPIYNLGDVMIQGLIRMTETWDPSGWADRDQFHLYHGDLGGALEKAYQHLALVQAERAQSEAAVALLERWAEA